MSISIHLISNVHISHHITCVYLIKLPMFISSHMYISPHLICLSYRMTCIYSTYISSRHTYINLITPHTLYHDISYVYLNHITMFISSHHTGKNCQSHPLYQRNRNNSFNDSTVNLMSKYSWDNSGFFLLRTRDV